MVWSKQPHLPPKGGWPFSKCQIKFRLFFKMHFVNGLVGAASHTLRKGKHKRKEKKKRVLELNVCMCRRVCVFTFLPTAVQLKRTWAGCCVCVCVWSSRLVAYKEITFISYLLIWIEFMYSVIVWRLMLFDTSQRGQTSEMLYLAYFLSGDLILTFVNHSSPGTGGEGRQSLLKGF